MNTTKKEHYVPQCYLRNFSSKLNNEKINVFDKVKGEVRLNQKILDNASERYFYDIDVSKIICEISQDKRQGFIDMINSHMDEFEGFNKQDIEKYFSSEIEEGFSSLLKSVIENTQNATKWYKTNCYSLTTNEKIPMSFYLAYQFIRTKKMREFFKEGSIKFSKSIAVKLWNIQHPNAKEKLTIDNVDSTIGKETLKVQHAAMMFSSDTIEEFAKAFYEHEWIISINKTKIPFWTSDAPIVIQPMLNIHGGGK